MKTQEARKLKPGDRVVIWKGTKLEATGEVAKHHGGAISFLWDDSQKSVIHIEDMAEVERLAPAHSEQGNG